MKKKIGLVVACKGSSYGMNLQAFATQYVIESMDYDTEILSFKKERNPFVYDRYLIVHLLNLLSKRIKGKLKKTNKKSNDPKHSENYKKRIIVAQEFRNKFLHNFTKGLSGQNLTSYVKDNYHAVLVGSDQVWLPGFSFTNSTSLFFVPDGVKKVAYSSSLGVSSYPTYCRHSAKKAWMRFDTIAVREDSGKKIIDDICEKQKDVKVVIDPTYLITKESWLDLIPYKQIIKEQYVLCFILGNNTEQQLCAKRFAEQKGLKLVSILSNESESPIDCTFADQTIIGASPEDFLNLIRGAEYVLTDSFHGIAFSVINEKQLFVFYRKRDDATGKMSRNTRIDNIMRMWGLTDYIIANPKLDWSTASFNQIDYVTVSKVLEEKRKDCLEVLNNALG